MNTNVKPNMEPMTLRIKRSIDNINRFDNNQLNNTDDLLWIFSCIEEFIPEDVVLAYEARLEKMV